MILGANSYLMLGVSYLIQNSLFSLEVYVGMILDPFLQICQCIVHQIGSHAIEFCTSYNVKAISNRKQEK